MALLDMYEQARVSASEFEEKHSEFSESLARELSFRRVDRVQPVAHDVQRSALQEIKPSQQQDSPQAVHRLSAKSTDDISSSPQSGRFAMRRASPRSSLVCRTATSAARRTTRRSWRASWGWCCRESCLLTKLPVYGIHAQQHN